MSQVDRDFDGLLNFEEFISLVYWINIYIIFYRNKQFFIKKKNFYLEYLYSLYTVYASLGYNF